MGRYLVKYLHGDTIVLCPHTLYSVIPKEQSVIPLLFVLVAAALTLNALWQSRYKEVHSSKRILETDDLRQPGEWRTIS